MAQKRRATRRSFGALRKLPSGSWQARYIGLDGKLHSAPSTFATKTDANMHLNSVRTDMARGDYRDPGAGRITLEEWGARWLSSHEHTIKATTAASYQSLWRCCIVPELGEVPLLAIKRSTVREWLAALTARGLGASRVRKSLVLLNLILDAAVDDDLIVANPARGVRAPRLPDHEPTILTAVQVAALRHAIPEPYKVLVDVLAYGGLRIGEAFVLRRRHVDVRRRCLCVRQSGTPVNGRTVISDTKTHQVREVTLPPFLIAALRERLDAIPDDPDALLWPSRVGTVKSYNAFRRYAFDPAVATAGIPRVTPHDLRATCGTWTADQLGPLAAAQRLGHSNASVTTRHYARARVGAQDDAAQHFEVLHSQVSESDLTHLSRAEGPADPAVEPRDERRA